MIINIKGFLEVFKLSRKNKFSIAIAATAIFAFKNSISAYVKVGNFYNLFGIYIVIVAIIMWAQLFSDICAYAKNFATGKRHLIRGKRKLRQLNTGETKIVERMYDKEDHMLMLGRSNTDVLELMAFGIILQTESMSPVTIENMETPKVAFVLQPWAARYYKTISGKQENS
ncbi:hypothetical protein C5Z25_12090 [Lactobacillus sp. CBA3605]|uniref:super-infection exclusion protein B n=1 Tax=Lactobacillus sp. CBA3605 TaxID=2099788 RepID=UPI000CFB6A31|nr:super-infection exclusion protein B [Lactobacillus sp. CBA3605]AVK62452.1 hypothetical protein C5Z25_12090 [Lactobacillus sp. CBA3605]